MLAPHLSPIVVDLFAGVGGMSLGAARAGYNVACAVEWDSIAISTHARNFPKSTHLEHDIAELSGEALLIAAGGTIDGIVGGPPCQGFSTIGKRNIADPRNELFSHFFRLVAEIRPKFFVAENVPGILSPRNANIVRAAISQLPEQYVLLEPKTVVASRFGASTTRTRVFFVGYDASQMNDLNPEELFADIESPGLTVSHILRGLPSIRQHWQSEEQGWRKVDYSSFDESQLQMVAGSIPPGVGCVNAIERLNLRQEISGNLGTIHSEEVSSRFRSTRPGTTEVVSRFPRLSADGYCPTLRAGTGSDRGSFQAVRPIHHTAARVVTPREAARLQGFPDWFQFHPTKWHAFRQIGNSVSPIVAQTLLGRISKHL